MKETTMFGHVRHALPLIRRRGILARMTAHRLLPFLALVGCTQAPASPAARAPAAAATPTTRLAPSALPLPGASGPASLDFIFYEPLAARVWVPAGSTGSVDVLDVASGAFTRIPGFKTEEREAHGKKRVVGPSSGSIGAGFAYIGNRAGSEICPVNLATLQPEPCVSMASSPDGVQYVASAKELWVTLPKDQSIAVLDASSPPLLKLKATLKLDGEPECYALDDVHGAFLTNLEDKGSTLAIDLKTRTVTATWNPGCGSDGPRGIAFDKTRGFVMVACTDHVQLLDPGHGGARLGALATGAGLDAIDYVDGTHLLYAAAGKAQSLKVARVTDAGQLELVAEGATSEGARNAVVDSHGDIYVADSQGGRLLLFRSAVGAR